MKDDRRLSLISFFFFFFLSISFSLFSLPLFPFSSLPLPIFPPDNDNGSLLKMTEDPGLSISIHLLFSLMFDDDRLTDDHRVEEMKDNGGYVFELATFIVCFVLLFIQYQLMHEKQINLIILSFFLL